MKIHICLFKKIEDSTPEPGVAFLSKDNTVLIAFLSNRRNSDKVFP